MERRGQKSAVGSLAITKEQGAAAMRKMLARFLTSTRTALTNKNTASLPGTQVFAKSFFTWGFLIAPSLVRVQNEANSAVNLRSIERTLCALLES